jgi:hypothetical protein
MYVGEVVGDGQATGSNLLPILFVCVFVFIFVSSWLRFYLFLFLLVVERIVQFYAPLWAFSLAPGAEPLCCHMNLSSGFGG